MSGFGEEAVGGGGLSIKVKGGGVQVEAEQSPRERGRWKSDAPSNLSSGQFCLGERPVKAVASTIERGSIGQRVLKGGEGVEVGFS